MKIQGKKEIFIDYENNQRESIGSKKIPAALKEKELMERISSVPVSEIPIDDIKSREINNFIISNIEELANSIDKIGQQQEVIVTTNEHGEYVMVAGHRRLVAIKYLRDKYKKLGNKEKTDKFSFIRARVLNSDEKEQENKIYLDTNTTTRIPTVFEALLGFDLKAMNFSDQDFLNKYLIAIYGKNGPAEYKKGNIKDRLNQNSLIKYLAKLIKENFSTMEVKEETIKRYLTLIKSAHPELIKKILDGSIELREGIVLARYDHEQQLDVINGKISKESLKNNTIPVESNNIEITNFSYDKVVNSLNRIGKNINDMYDYLSSLNKKELTGNQKEIIKKVKEIKKNLNEISKMPSK